MEACAGKGSSRDFTADNIADDLKYSWLILVAKGDKVEDEARVARNADEARPVLLANSDSKLCEAVVDKPLARAMASWASEERLGFFRDRMIVDNVIEIDTYGRFAAMPSCSRTGEIDMLLLMAFFDFAAAFPSVAWACLWLCMRYCGLPRAYIRAFQKLHRNNAHFLRYMGKFYRAYINACGVKTGGTASGTIFVLNIDPFLQML